jgi:hypothetical protein
METSGTESAGSNRAELVKLIAKIESFVRTAEAVAERNVGKVRTLAALDLLAAVWLGYAFYNSFDWGWAPAFVVFATVATPALVLWKIHGTLKPMIGLPQRLTGSIARLHDKAAAYKQQLDDRGAAATVSSGQSSKPRFAELWETGKLIAELRGLSGEAREIALEAGSALVLANPIFPIVLGVTSTLAAIAVTLGIVVGGVYLL